MTGQTAALVPDLEGVIFESRGRKSLRNVSEPVDLFAVLRTGESGAGNLPIDPVCRMAVDPERAPGELKYTWKRNARWQEDVAERALVTLLEPAKVARA